MYIAVFGLGYVGTVTATCLAERGHRVTGADTDERKVAAIAAGRSPVIEPGLDELLSSAVSTRNLGATGSVARAVSSADVSIVCVGTPSTAEGGTDLSHVRRVCADIGAALAAGAREHTVLVRSTVPPGTVEEVLVPEIEAASGRTVGSGLRVAMCPEFLREGSSVHDFFHPPLVVIGGSAEAAAAVRELFGFPDCLTHVVAIRTAESIKYACNAFHALKVSFSNELARLYRTLDVDSRRVMEVFTADERLNISPAYLRPGFAFGGSCLPKDLRSLLHLARMNSVDTPVLEATLRSNDMLVREVADRVLHAVDSTVTGNGDRTVALLGLSFKQNTDDLRESPNVGLAEILIGKGLDVRIHDPVVNPAGLSGANLTHVRARLPHLHRVLYDDPEQALRGARVAIVCSSDSGIAGAVAAARPPAVFDLDGRIGAPIESLHGYQGVGW